MLLDIYGVVVWYCQKYYINYCSIIIHINIFAAIIEMDVNSKSAISDLTWNGMGLSEVTLMALRSMNFPTPTPIQQAVIPGAIKQRKDVIGAAETGSGKTLAFAVPILERWLEQGHADIPKEEVRLFALIISPTRELTIQIKQVLKEVSAKTGPRAMNTVAIVGGISEQKQQRLLKSRPDVIVATPGRLWALRQTGTEHLMDLSGLRILVVDEIDRMLEQGHFEELRHIVQDIHRFMKEEHLMGLDGGNLAQNKTELPQNLPRLQTLIFSATLTFTHHIPLRRGEKVANESKLVDPKQKVRRIAQTMLMRKGPGKLAVFDLTPPQKTPQALIECRMNCGDLLEKDTNLLYVLRRYGGRTLVFGNSVSAIRRLQAVLRKLTMPGGGLKLPRLLHGRMKEKERLKSLERFSESDDSILLATDVAARGLDFRDVQTIIHYQVPKTTENYIHRSGRTARATKAGLSVLFVDPLDLHQYQKICRNMNKDQDLEVLMADKPELMEQCRQLVELASEAESLEHQIKKKKSKNQWFEKIAREADLEWDEGTSGGRDEDDGPTKEELFGRRRKAIERALRGMLKDWKDERKEKEEGEGEEANSSGRREEMRKRLRLEKGAKKWVKRRKVAQ